MDKSDSHTYDEVLSTKFRAFLKRRKQNKVVKAATKADEPFDSINIANSPSKGVYNSAPDIEKCHLNYS